MGEQDRLLLRILRGTSDANIPFDGLCHLLRRLGFAEPYPWQSPHLHQRGGRRNPEPPTQRPTGETLPSQASARCPAQIPPRRSPRCLMTCVMKSSSIGVRRTKPSLRKSPNCPVVQPMAPPTRKP